MSFWKCRELLISWMAHLARAHPLKSYTISQGLHNVPGYDSFPHLTLASFQNSFCYFIQVWSNFLETKDPYKLQRKIDPPSVIQAYSQYVQYLQNYYMAQVFSDQICKTLYHFCSNAVELWGFLNMFYFPNLNNHFIPALVTTKANLILLEYYQLSLYLIWESDKRQF